jgi:VanZ family protein
LTTETAFGPIFLFEDCPELSRREFIGYDTRMLHKLIGLAAWGLLAFIAYATISPIQVRPTLPTSTSFEHLAAFAVLGALFSLAYPRQVALVCLIVLGSAVLLELLQLLTPDRHGRVPDAIEKIAGGVVGIVAGHAILYFDQAGRWFQN